jgi:WD40 repeat protein/energy-coupling factor transporter ATP-binding protein EcfA2
VGRITVEQGSAIARQHPLPIADAMTALLAAQSPHERRDRVVECFRATLRYVAAVALAARVQFGPGPGDESAQVADLMRSLRRRGLTDGQWVGLTRQLLAAWAGKADAHAITPLAALFTGKAKKHVAKAIDGLLEMRKAETVAHGATGTADALAAVLERREPQLAALLERLAPIWEAARLVVPLAAPEDDEPQRAWLLMGDTPSRGRWPAVSLSTPEPLAPGMPVLVDPEGKPLLSLDPVALFRRPSPDAVEELFVLDGAKRNAAVFVALPSMAELKEREVWAMLGRKLFDEDEGDDAAPQSAGHRRPYRGLASFGPEHAGLFFGREKLVEAVANRIRRQPLVTVTGPSGSGKSSLLLAGVLPELGDLTKVVVRPGSHPCDVLARRLAEALDDEPEAIATILDERPETLGSFLDERFRRGGPALLLLVDQAEEIFTLGADSDERHRYAEAIASAGLDPDGATRVVMSLREDYFARLSTLGPLRGRYSRHVEVVATPDREDLYRILFLPAQAFGYRFEDEELVAEMVTSVEDEPAALAMLQFCADQLWERRDRTWKRLTRDAYRAIGGVEGALAAHADAVIDGMTDAMQTAARSLLLRCVTEDHTRAVVPSQELVEAIGEGAEAVLDRLVDARLLTVRSSEERAVELVHEALLVHWARLRGWLSDDDHLQRIQARIGQAASGWQRDGRPGDRLLGDGKPLLEAEELLAKRRPTLRDDEVAFIEASRTRSLAARRLRRAAIAGLALLTVLAAGFGVLAWTQRGRALSLATIADANQKEANERAVTLVIEQGRRELLDGHPTRAARLLVEAKSRGGDGIALATMLAEAMRAVDSHRDAWEPELSEYAVLKHLDVSPDGTRVFASDNQGHFWVWRLADHGLVTSGRIRESKKISVRVNRVRFEDDRIALGGDGGDLVLVNRAGAIVWRAKQAGSILDLVFVRDGLLVVSSEGSIVRYALADGRVLDERNLDGKLASAAIGLDGARISVGREDGRWTILDTATGDALHETQSEGPVRKTTLGSRHWAGLSMRKRRHLQPGEEFDYGVELPARSVLSLLETSDLSVEAPITVEGRVDRMSLSPEDARVALVRFPNEVELWRTNPPRRIQSWSGHERYAARGSSTSPQTRALSFDPSGRRLVTRGGDENLHIHDAKTGGRLMTLVHRGPVMASDWDATGNVLVSAHTTGPERGPTLNRWVPKSPLLATLRARPIPIGDYVLTPEDRGAWSAWREEGGAWTKAPALAPEESLNVHRASDGVTSLREFVGRVVVVSADGTEGDKLKVRNPGSLVVSLDVHLPTKRLLVGYHNHVAELWSLDGTRLRELELPNQAGDVRVETVAFSRNGRLGVTAQRGQAVVFDLDDGRMLLTTAEPERGFAMMPTVRFSQDDRRLLDATGALSTKMWDLHTQKVLYEVEGSLVALSHDDSRLATVSDGSPVASLYDASSGELLHHLEGHDDSITALAISDDGARLFTGDRSGWVRIWDTATGVTLVARRAHAEGLQSLHVLGERLLSATRLGSAIWDVSLDRRDVATLEARLDAVAPWRLQDGRLVPIKPTTRAAARRSD